MPDTNRVARYERALDFAERQVAALVDQYPDYFPIYTTQGRWHHAGELWTDWTGGFLVGMMWQFHRRTGSAAWRERAQHYATAAGIPQAGHESARSRLRVSECLFALV